MHKEMRMKRGISLLVAMLLVVMTPFVSLAAEGTEEKAQSQASGQTEAAAGTAEETAAGKTGDSVRATEGTAAGQTEEATGSTEGDPAGKSETAAGGEGTSPSEAEGTEAAESSGQAAAQSKKIITGFEEMDTTAYYFEGEPTEEELTKFLPETITAYTGEEKKEQKLAVTWQIVEDYQDSSFYFYSVKPVWDEEVYGLSADLDAEKDVPWLLAFRQRTEEEVKSGETEPVIPMDDAEDMEPLYTEEDGPVDPEKAGKTSLLDVLGKFTEKSYAVSDSEEAAIYKYLTKTMGLNRAAACGVMTNLYAESGLLSNNLENTYNRKYGLSDAEYTSRVNKGIKNKGQYKTKNGKTRYFTKDYCGYGLAQWTSLGRRTNLLNKAVKKKTSIANRNMQLEFLKEELQKSYPQVWKTLKSVPNTAEGAYLAATEFCIAFEVPANTYETAASRGKTCLKTYWKKYSGKAAGVTGPSYLGICGYTYPSSVKTGKGVDCAGHVISNYRVKTATAAITNSKGKTVYKKTISPKTTTFSLYKFDSAMKFSKLKPGTYYYSVTAKDAKKTVSFKHKFTVGNKAATKILRGFKSKK